MLAKAVQVISIKHLKCYSYISNSYFISIMSIKTALKQLKFQMLQKTKYSDMLKKEQYHVMSRDL